MNNEYEHEYITANTLENWKRIVDAIFCGDCEIKRTIAKYDKDSNCSFTVVWDKADRVEAGREYRRKKPQPKKIKKLVPRTPEDFWPLIGKWWGKHKENKTNRFLILNANVLSDQEDWEIAPLGTEEWQPMMKEVEVEE